MVAWGGAVKKEDEARLAVREEGDDWGIDKEQEKENNWKMIILYKTLNI